MASSSSYSNPPCAACKFLRRKCLPSCLFAPYFPPEEPIKFTNVHKIFGASNVSKLLNEIQPHQREDAVNSLAYEAEARLKDPVYGCVGAISVLQRQVIRLQKELDAINADLMQYANYAESQGARNQMVNQQQSYQYGRRRILAHGEGGIGTNTIGQTYAISLPSYSSPWNSGISGDQYYNGTDGASGR